MMQMYLNHVKGAAIRWRLLVFLILYKITS